MVAGVVVLSGLSVLLYWLIKRKNAKLPNNNISKTEKNNINQKNEEIKVVKYYQDDQPSKEKFNQNNNAGN